MLCCCGKIQNSDISEESGKSVKSETSETIVLDMEIDKAGIRTDEESVSEDRVAETADEADTPETADHFYFEDTKTAREHDQLIIVGEQENCRANFTFYEKDDEGKWDIVFSTVSYVGRHGYNDNRHQGDETTPTGLYHFTEAFGIADDPGCALGYTKVNSHHYWVGNSDSPYYNRMVSDLETKNFSKKASEHLIAYTVPYQYCLNISFNTEQTPGRGSAIFLHCYSERQDTGGCVAIPKDKMRELLKKVKRDCVIAINPKEGDLDKEVL